MSQFLMPSLGADMTSGKLVEQTIAAGEAFQRGDVIAAVETQKGVIEVEVFEDGVLDRWLVDLGTEVPVGMPLAVIAHEGDPQPDHPEIPSEPKPPMPPDIPVVRAEPDPTQEPTPPETVPLPPEPQPQLGELSPTTASETSATPYVGATRPRITPAARRLAAELGIDPAGLTLATDQILNRQQIEQLAVTLAETRDSPAPKSDAAGEMRKAIAAAMTRSKREIPHYYLAHQVDLTTADAYLTKLNAERAPTTRLLMGALFARAIALALTKFPEFNGHYKTDGFCPAEAVHLGIAIHIRTGGLVAPALFDAETRTADDLMQGLSDLVSRVRAGRFKARELSDATITMTSLGARGVDLVTGVIYPPQVAIVGVGTPRLRPMVHDEHVVPRLSATLSLAADHRVSDGHRGALFLRAIDTKLQEPQNL
ncbi:2-oxo acid dehydrogenase subunit E2 [Aliiroseovarius sp. S1339]|uniref:dihydrolipoamide acetyltransferase family protein n=1 Tax=Aliiroseovarius sp. S1339 TaxID=2936990 RepID=UPI0020BF345B|nr:dihydrolipoamide acetyltransferase family protein [Aliiroseovarius sp. S1339]MCK8462452.1 2-oxo acid dehydrogenase subunit E2 [Aliiroseovarius sp. S1339]